MVRVEATLKGGLDIQRQRRMWLQSIEVLSSLGFKNADAYDHHDYQRIVGVAPVDQLEKLITPMRSHPAAWKLLDSSALSDLRTIPNGKGALLTKILEGWYDYPPSQPLIEALFVQWESMPAAIRLIQTLPIEVVDNDDKTVYKEFLLRHIISHPDSKKPLSKLLENVLASKSAPELMKQFLDVIGPVADRLPLPLLFKNEPVVRVVEVFPSAPLPSVQGPPEDVAAELEKIAPDLRALLGDEKLKNTEIRMEAVLAQSPSDENNDWIGTFNATKSFAEGRLGNVVTLVGPIEDAKVLSQFPAVTSVRLPRPASDLTTLRNDLVVPRLKFLGEGQRIAILASDFQGWEPLKGKQLPADTTLVDLTRELDPDMHPTPYPAATEVGMGTQCALAVAATVSGAKITLIRIDPKMPYMVQHAAKAINGGSIRSLNLIARQYEVERDDALLKKEQKALLEERANVLFKFDEEGNSEEKREAYFKKQKAFDAKLLAYKNRRERYLELVSDVQSLRNVEAVWSTLGWNVGYAQGGLSPLSRYLDDAPFEKIWLQSTATLAQQSWFGVFRDRDDNHYMEFTSPDAPVPADGLSAEYNFLAWQGKDQAPVMDLPAEAVIRIAIQWQEIQDSYYSRVGQDPYKRSKADLYAQVLFQPDPKGEQRPADDLEWVQQWGGPSRRLERFSNRSVYEQTVLFKTTKPGHYVFRVVGSKPSGYTPSDPGLSNRSEIMGRVEATSFRADAIEFGTCDSSRLLHEGSLSRNARGFVSLEGTWKKDDWSVGRNKWCAVPEARILLEGCTTPELRTACSGLLVVASRRAEATWGLRDLTLFPPTLYSNMMVLCGMDNRKPTIIIPGEASEGSH